MLPFEVEEGKDGSDYRVYYIDEKGDLKKVAAEYVDGHMVFTTAHFSEYAIVYEGKTVTNEPEVTVIPEVPVEENNFPVLPVLISVIVMLIGAILLVLKKKSDKSN